MRYISYVILAIYLGIIIGFAISFARSAEAHHYHYHWRAHQKRIPLPRPRPATAPWGDAQRTAPFTWYEDIIFNQPSPYYQISQAFVDYEKEWR